MFNKFSIFFFLLLHYLVGHVVLVNGKGTEFDFGTSSLTSLNLLGDAHLNNGSVRLTRDLPVPNSGSGRVLYNKPVRFRQQGSRSPASFSTFFTFSVINLNPSSIGGGLAFLITPDDQVIGDAGGFLGLNSITSFTSSDTTSSALTGFIGVEFDTLMDVQFNDINGNHVGLDLNTLVSTEVCDLGEVGVELKSGNLVNAWIDYDAPTKILNISVSYSNLQPKVPLLSIHLDLDQFVNDFMFVGFSGSTQGSTEIHSIEWWSFSSSFSSSSSNANSPAESPPPPPPPPSSPTFFKPTV